MGGVNRIDAAKDFIDLNFSTVTVDSTGDNVMRILIEPRQQDVDVLICTLRDTYKAARVDQECMQTAGSAEPKIGFVIYWDEAGVVGPVDEDDEPEPVKTSGQALRVLQSPRITWAMLVVIAACITALAGERIVNTLSYMLDM